MRDEPGVLREARKAYPSASGDEFYRACQEAFHASGNDAAKLLHTLDAAPEPAQASWYFLRGWALEQAGRWEEAAGMYADAARVNVQDAAEPFYRMGLALAQLGLHPQALQAYDRALGCRRNHRGARFSASISMRRLGRVGEALRLLDEVPEPLGPAWVNNRAEFLLDQGRVAEALRLLRTNEDLLRAHAGLHSSLVRAMLYDPAATAHELFNETGRWHAWHAAAGPVPPFAGLDTTPGRVLRVGYVSACMFKHNSSAHLMQLLRAHDRSQYHLLLYHAGSLHDEWTAELRGLADTWREISTLSDEAAAGVIRGDRVDILVDLNEHANNGRLRLFTYKPAPLQFHWYGNAVTTGIKEMDGRFSDAIAEPPGEADRWSHERIIRLATGYHCYGPPPGAVPPTAELPCVRQGHITFGAVHNLAKMNAGVLACWQKILAATPGAKLLLARDVLADADTRALFNARLQQAGLDPTRVILCGDQARIATLAIYHELDLVLDSFPFNGDATTCDALWMGIPVITLRGDRLSARRAAGLLQLVGHPEWIASSPEEYVALAVEWAGDRARLAQAHEALSADVRRSALCQAPWVAREIEAAYRHCWREYGCRQPGGQGTFHKCANE